MTDGSGRQTRLARKRFDLSRNSDRTAAIAIAIAALLALLILSPFGSRPGDPAAVAADARLARCGGTLSDVEFAFAIPQVSDYQRYLPAMVRTAELDVTRAALVVVYKRTFSLSGSPDPGAATDIRDVCIYVGTAGQGSLNYFSDVSVAGLRATLTGPVLVPPVQT